MDSTNDLPVMCTLSPAAMAARKPELFAGLITRADSIEPQEGGVRISFPPSTDTLQALVTAIEGERQCCRFLRFDIRIEPDRGPIVLQVTGPRGTRQLLESLGWF